MKQFLLISLLIPFAAAISAQNIAFYDKNDNPIQVGQPYVLNGSTGFNEVVAEFKVKNIGSQPIDVKVRKQDITLIGGSEFYFCWGGCFEPNITESPDACTIAPNTFAEWSLDLHLMPSTTTPGTNVVAVVAFNQNNPADSVRLVLQYEISTSIGDTGKAIAKLYPNPTDGDLNITNSMGKTLTIFNAIGQVVYKNIIISDQEMFDISELKSGIYMVQISDNGNISDTRKLIKR